MGFHGHAARRVDFARTVPNGAGLGEWAGHRIVSALHFRQHLATVSMTLPDNPTVEEKEEWSSDQEKRVAPVAAPAG
jgi:hypothetical protein